MGYEPFNLRCHWLAPNLANTSLECRGNLDLVFAFLPWDHGCALFVVFISAIKSTFLGKITEIFQTQLRWIVRRLAVTNP